MFDNIGITHLAATKVIIPLIFMLPCIPAWSQDVDTSSYAQPKELEEITVTATRKNENLSQIAYNTTVLNQKEMQSLPVYNLDDVFTTVAGMNQDRKNGIFSGSKNTVNLMGITGGEQGRVLVLEDGIPVNGSDNGEVNWNRFCLSDFSRIEIIKGSASSLYGSNAMGGIINLVSALPQKPFELNAGLSYGSYNTVMSNVSLAGKKGRFYWKAAANYNRSDGTIMPPDSLRDSTDVATFLSEGGARLKAGYRVNDYLTVDASYSFYDDKHGDGTKILDEEGSYSRHKTHVGRLGTNFDNQKWFFNLNLFIQKEDYGKLIEKLKGTTYTAIDVTSERSDAGLLTYAGKRFRAFTVSLGADLRTGSTKGADVYRTSADIVKNQGTLTQFSSHIHAESNFFDNRLALAGALYYSIASLHDASFMIENPTSETSYMNEFAGALSDTIWSALSPSLSLLYRPVENVNLRLIYSHGFRAPTIDDLTRSGMVNIGFKEANPFLRPEKINNVQLNLNTQINPSLFASADVYYLSGSNYIYYLETGETIFNGKKKVYRKENLNEVQAIGGDLTLKWKPVDWIRAYANLNLNQSVIRKNESLEGKFLTYSPGHMEGFGIITENKIVDGAIHFAYKGKQFMDDLNESPIPAYGIVNLLFSKKFADHFKVSLTVQNLLNKTYLYDGHNLTLGRFISGSLELFL
jgi:iron complex outermembrane recepter protein